MKFVFPSQIESGDSGPALLLKIAQFMASTDEIINLMEYNFEITINGLFGKGILDNSWINPLLSSGTGLSINVAPHTEINGFENIITVQQQIPVPANSTKYLWVLQNNENLSPSYALTDSISSDPSDEYATAIILGSITTNDTVVTNITPLFSIVKPLSEYTPVVSGAYIPRQDTFTLAWDADLNTRSGGTLYAVTLDFTPIPTAPLKVFRDNVRILPTVGFTTSTDGAGHTVVTFLDGWKPITDTGVSETVIVEGFSAT